MGFLEKILGKKPKNGQVAVSSEKYEFTISTSYPSRAAAEEALTSSSGDRLDAASALGMTNSQLVVPALAKALLNDQNKYVRATCAGYLGSIKGNEAEKSLLQAKSDPDPYVRKCIVEALFRLATEQTLRALDEALEDHDSEVQAVAKKYKSISSMKIQKGLCPFLSKLGMCDQPGVSEFFYCAWEIQGRGRHKDCLIFQANMHPGGRMDFLKRNT